MNDTTTENKEDLKTKNEIEAKLKETFVFCDLPERQRVIVRDVGFKDGVLKVKVLEGWRTPIKVYVT